MLSRVKKPAILLLLLSLILGLATAGFLLAPDRLPGIALPIRITLGGPADSTSSVSAAAPAENPASAVPPAVVNAEGNGSRRVEGLLYDVGTRVVNLADPGGYRYLKVGIVLELLPTDPEFYAASGEARAEAEQHVLDAVGKQQPLIEDIITMALTDKTFEEVFTIAGKEQLKQELREALNARLSEQQVRDIYFTEFLIQ